MAWFNHSRVYTRRDHYNKELALNNRFDLILFPQINVPTSCSCSNIVIYHFFGPPYSVSGAYIEVTKQGVPDLPCVKTHLILPPVKDLLTVFNTESAFLSSFNCITLLYPYSKAVDAFSDIKSDTIVDDML